MCRGGSKYFRDRSVGWSNFYLLKYRIAALEKQRENPQMYSVTI